MTRLDAPPAVGDGEVLRRAILANPEDDDPRLQYADWLREQGDEARADFIAVQCESAGRCPARGDMSLCLRGYYGPCKWCHRVVSAWNAWAVPEIEAAMAAGRGWANLPGVAVGWWPGGVTMAANGDEARYAFRRGFVDRVETTLAAYLPGPCGRCEGRKEIGDSAIGWRKCPVCHGTGTTPGAAGVVRREPVSTVRLVGCEPFRTIGGLSGWTCDDEDRHSAAWLPDPLWDRLEPKGSRSKYQSADAALAALSAAAIAYARR